MGRYILAAIPCDDEQLMIKCLQHLFQLVQLDTAANIGQIKEVLSNKSKREAVDKLQELMDQINMCMTALQD